VTQVLYRWKGLPFLAIICNKFFPFLATFRSIKIVIFGNIWDQNLAKNGKKVTQGSHFLANHFIAISGKNMLLPFFDLNTDKAFSLHSVPTEYVMV